MARTRNVSGALGSVVDATGHAGRADALAGVLLGRAKVDDHLAGPVDRCEHVLSPDDGREVRRTGATRASGSAVLGGCAELVAAADPMILAAVEYQQVALSGSRQRPQRVGAVLNRVAVENERALTADPQLVETARRLPRVRERTHALIPQQRLPVGPPRAGDVTTAIPVVVRRSRHLEDAHARVLQALAERRRRDHSPAVRHVSPAWELRSACSSPMNAAICRACAARIACPFSAVPCVASPMIPVGVRSLNSAAVVRWLTAPPNSRRNGLAPSTGTSTAFSRSTRSGRIASICETSSSSACGNTSLSQIATSSSNAIAFRSMSHSDTSPSSAWISSAADSSAGCAPPR